MKQLSTILGLLLFFGLSSCNNGGNKKIDTNVVKNPASAQKKEVKTDDNLPVMTFEETVHDFGQMIRGEKVHYSFKFKNTGKSDLIITRVSTSCGCTVGHYPHKPVKPGESSSIDVTFDSTHKRGFQNKSITILANTNPNRTVLRIKANVISPEKD
jgi:hypothetical protein